MSAAALAHTFMFIHLLCIERDRKKHVCIYVYSMKRKDHKGRVFFFPAVA